MKLAVYDKKGKEIKQVQLPKDIFDVSWNADLVHQVATAMFSSHRSGTAHSKNRGEVSGGGKKPWRQKGTGRARHGSIRSPLWIGGGTTFGPRSERNYERLLSKKIRSKALVTVLSQKVRDVEVILIDSIKTDTIKTKDAVKTIEALAKNKDFEGLIAKKENAAVVVVPERDQKTEKSFQNIKNLRFDLARNLNIMDLLNYKFLVIVNPEESFKILSNRVKNLNNKNQDTKKVLTKKSK